MNNSKDNGQGILADATPMGNSSPAVHGSPQGRFPNFPPPYPPPHVGDELHPPTPVPGFQVAPTLPQTSNQGPTQEVYPPTPPGYKPVAEGDNNIYAPQDLGEDGQVKQFDFTEQSIRRAFVRKVYGILMCQLLISLAFIALFLFCRPVKLWAADNPIMLGVAMVVYIAMAFSMICCGNLRRKAPVNFIFLGIFTLATSYMLGVITSSYDIDLVMIAVGLTAAVVLALTIFAFQTKYDFTGMGSALLCALVILILFGFISMFMRHRVVEILYSAAGAMIFSLYIIYDTQLMMGGQHKYSITPEEYIFAALNLYLDVINLFLHILSLVARR